MITTTMIAAAMAVAAKGGLMEETATPELRAKQLKALEDVLKEALRHSEPVRYSEHTVRYMYAQNPTPEQRAAIRASELHKKGDAILVWVNEGDILFHQRFPHPN